MAVPPPLPVPETKPEMRRRLRAARTAHVAALGLEGAATSAAQIAERLRAPSENSGVIGGYVAHGGEPNVLGVLLDAHAKGRKIALPRVKNGAMRFVRWTPDMVLTEGFAGIREPAAGREIVPATLLVPLVGFDRAGRRLGQGAGCYDRWLAAHPGTRTIGVAWAMQEVAAIPADTWDVTLDAIVTEEEWIAP